MIDMTIAVICFLCWTILFMIRNQNKLIEKQTTHICNKLTEQNQYINPMVGKFHSALVSWKNENGLASHPYRDSNSLPKAQSTKSLSEVQSFEATQNVLVDWIPGQPCPYCNTKHDDNEKYVVTPYDGATLTRPFLLWSCSICASEWETTANSKMITKDAFISNVNQPWSRPLTNGE